MLRGCSFFIGSPKTFLENHFSGSVVLRHSLSLWKEVNLSSVWKRRKEKNKVDE